MRKILWGICIGMQKKRFKLLFLQRLEDEKERLAKRRCCEQFSVDTRYAPFLLQEFIGLTTFFVHLYRFIYTFQHCPRTRFLTSIRWAKSTESSNYCTNYHHMIMKSGKSKKEEVWLSKWVILNLDVFQVLQQSEGRWEEGIEVICGTAETRRSGQGNRQADAGDIAHPFRMWKRKPYKKSRTFITW